MKKKTIEVIISKKIDEWKESIKDERVKGLVDKNTIVTGGCIASMLLGEQVNDFDIYFTNKETTKAVAEYYVKQWNDAHSDDGYVLDGAMIPKKDQSGGVGLNMTPDRIKVIFASKGMAKEKNATQETDELDELTGTSRVVEEKKEYRPIFLSSNAITLSDRIQLVLRFYGDAETIHQHYDYVHCTNYWLSDTKKLTLNQPALEALLAKELIYVGSKYPLASIIRTRKFIKRGWTINAGQLLKMSFQLSELDLKDIDVLEDQCTGVDVAYFGILIDALQEHAQNMQSEKKEFVISTGYLSVLIDKIFS